MLTTWNVSKCTTSYLKLSLKYPKKYQYPNTLSPYASMAELHALSQRDLAITHLDTTHLRSPEAAGAVAAPPPPHGFSAARAPESSSPPRKTPQAQPTPPASHLIRDRCSPIASNRRVRNPFSRSYTSSLLTHHNAHPAAG